jgi:hypothetical protein
MKGYITGLEKLSPAHTSTERDERITRLVLLKAAPEFDGLWGQTREVVKPDHVLADRARRPMARVDRTSRSVD